MKFTSILSSAVLLQNVLAFVPSTTTIQPTFTTSSSKLYISSWGSRGPPSLEKEEDVDPERKIQSYLKEPQSVEAKANLDGTVLVSGWVNTKERTDQTVFDFLNHEESAFRFEKIVAFVDDSKFAKKRLISRSARYTGLLDKLDFIQAETPGALPTLDQLMGVKSWVVNAGSDLGVVKQVAELVKNSPHVENVAVLITEAQTTSTADQQAVLGDYQFLSDMGKTFAIVAVGSITESPEGSMPYALNDFGTEGAVLPTDAVYGRDESLRLVTECLGLSSGSNKAIVFSEVDNVNMTEAKLIKGLREGGYTRPQEIDHMLVKGAAVYQKAIDEYKVRKPEVTQHDEWLATKQKELEDNAAERKQKAKEEYEEKKRMEIEEIAREWAKREYFRKSMSGDMPYSEEEYVKSVWDRALFEGDLKYRMMRGMDTDERKELADFKKKQEKKKAMMLQRAKQSLEEALGEDILTKTGDDDDEE